MTANGVPALFTPPARPLAAGTGFSLATTPLLPLDYLWFRWLGAFGPG